MRDCRLDQPEFHQSANVINHVRTGFAIVTTMINLFISAFDSRLPPPQGDLLSDVNWNAIQPHMYIKSTQLGNSIIAIDEIP